MTKLIYATLLLVALLGQTYAVDIYHPIRSVLGKQRSLDVGMAEGKYTPEEEKDPNFWNNQAQADLKLKLAEAPNLRRAKNIIFFLGDGMSVATLTAARILKGQRWGNTGEESKLAMESLPYAGFSKTYCTNGQTPDSACTATAYLCGVKTNMMMTGLNAHANFNNCSASADTRHHVESIATWAQRAGKSTGIVTTTTVTHASPSAAYAHAANRMWESDSDMATFGVDRSEGCLDIATQLITQQPGRSFNVILGGGMTKFLPNTRNDAFGTKGERLDGINLIEKWKQNNPAGKFITTRSELLNLNHNAVDNIFGTFNSKDLEFHLEAAQKRPTQPTLEEMAIAAIKQLDKNSRGYFLFVEGGRIDHGHHATAAPLALDETLEFDKAIAAAIRLTSTKDTLIVVSADHAHTMSMAGYPGRGNPITGVNQNDVDINGTPYNTLNYAVGIKNYMLPNGQREDLSGNTDTMALTPSYVQAEMGTHDGQDVPILAGGPHAHLFSGVMQQNNIPHYMAYAAKIGNGLK